MHRATSADIRSVLRAVRVLQRRMHRVDEETLATLLVEKKLRSRDMHSLFYYFFDCWHVMEERERSARAPKLICVECGEPIDASNRLTADERALVITLTGNLPTVNPRSDIRYCSSKCRQRAYRKRVTAATHPTQATTVTVTRGENLYVQDIRNEANTDDGR